MAANKHETELKVISWNINGLKEKKKDKKKITQMLETFKLYDIVLLQETHLGTKSKTNKSLEKAPKLKEEGKDEDDQEQSDMNSSSGSEDEEEQGKSKIPREIEDIYQVSELHDKTCLSPEPSQRQTMYVTSFDSRSRGVAIIVNKPHKCLKAYSEGGDFAWVYIEIEYVKYTFVSVYYHQKEKSDLMWRILHSFLIHEPEAWTKSWLVIGGDFNTTLDPVLDLGQENPQHKALREKLKEFMRIVELKDVWREKNPEERKYTYSCKKPKSRLDYVFMLQEDLEIVKNCNIPEDPQFTELSDPVSVEEKFSDLSDPYFVEDKFSDLSDPYFVEDKFSDLSDPYFVEDKFSDLSDHFPVVLTLSSEDKTVIQSEET